MVEPTKASAYFVLRAREMRAFSAGLKIVAGAHADSPQPLAVTYWSCSMREGTRWRTPRSCASSPATGPRAFQPHDDRESLLQLDVFFPDCWDGRHLDSADHRSHMAYSRDWACARSHPVKVPRLRFIVTYPIQKPDHLSLASGGIYSGHADFFNGWRQAALERIVADCFYYRPRCNLPPSGTRAPRAATGTASELSLSARWLVLRQVAIHIRGRLTAGGRPLAGRAVELSASSGAEGPRVIRTVRSAADGSFGLHLPVVSAADW